MEYKMKKISCLLFCLSILLTSCDLFAKKTDDNIIPEYKGNVVWEKELKDDGAYTQPIQYGNFIYGYEYIEGESYYLYKLNLQNGDYDWRKQVTLNTAEFSPLLFDDILYVYFGNGLFKCFLNTNLDGKEKGDLLATVRMTNSETGEYSKILNHTLLITTDGKYLFWNYINNDRNSINDDGIMRVSLSDIDFSKSAEEEQVLNAELIWKGEFVDNDYKYDETVRSQVLEDNGFIYFITDIGYSNTLHNRLGCFAEDIVETNNVKWIKNLEGFSGKTWTPLYIIDDDLFVFNSDIGCFNKNDGSEKWTKVQSAIDLISEPRCGGFIANSAGIWYDDGLFYYTTTDGWGQTDDYGCDQSLLGNIKCLDAKTGNLKWWYMPRGSGWLDTRPVVSNGKVFVNTWGNGLYVFDEKTGSVIGADTNVYSSGTDRNYVCDGNVIYFNYDTSSGTRTLTCIKP